MLVSDDGIAVALKLMLEHPSPFLLYSLQLLLRHGDDTTVTGEEVLTERLWLLGEVYDVSRCLVFIASTAIEIIHQYPVSRSVVQGEDARPLHVCPCAGIGIEILKVLLPGAFQVLRCSLLYAVLHLFSVLVLRVALVEEVIGAILLDDVIVYRAILSREELSWLTLKGREVLVGIGVEGDEALSVVACPLQGEVYHVFLCLAVVDGLRCPHPVGVAKCRPVLGQVDLPVGPVDQVLRLHHHDTRILIPSIFGHHHVGSHDIVASVLTPQDVRVAYAAALADGV